MTAHRTKPRTPPGTANEVRLVGRVAQQPEERVLPSGDAVWTFRVVVPREPDPNRPRQPVDALECAAWTGRARRGVGGGGGGPPPPRGQWLGRRRRRGGRGRPAPAVLPDRWRRRLTGGGG